MNGIELRMHRLAKPYHGSGTPIGVHFTKNRPLVRRGERGWERWGGPLWTQSGGLCGPWVGRLAPQRFSERLWAAPTIYGSVDQVA